MQQVDEQVPYLNLKMDTDRAQRIADNRIMDWEFYGMENGSIVKEEPISSPNS